MADAAVRKPKTFSPNWDAIMKVLGDPKQEAVYVNRSMDPATMDGSWDFNAMQKGLGMRRVAADIGKSNTEIQTPSGFVFICGNCGFARRVVDSEHSFTCERPTDAGPKGCGVIWEVELEDSEEATEDGEGFKQKPIYEERTAIGKMNRKYMMPKITGRLVSDMRRETVLARKAAGQASYDEVQPQQFGKTQPAARRVVEPPLVVPDLPQPSAGGAM